MADEKLPEWLLKSFQRYVGDIAQGHTQNRSERWRELRLAIHRFAREREAAALERCVDAASNEAAYVHSTTSSVVNAVRSALSPQVGSDNKEPANG